MKPNLSTAVPVDSTAAQRSITDATRSYPRARARLAVLLLLSMLVSFAGLVAAATPAAACGVYFSADEIPAGTAYASYHVDDGWDAYWIYVVEPAPGSYCGA